MTAEGSVYRRKDERWVAQYTDAKGKVRYLYRKSGAEARKALREALRDRDDKIVPAAKMTSCNLPYEWLEVRQKAISRRAWINQETNRKMPHKAAHRLPKAL